MPRRPVNRSQLRAMRITVCGFGPGANGSQRVLLDITAEALALAAVYAGGTYEQSHEDGDTGSVFRLSVTVPPKRAKPAKST